MPTEASHTNLDPMLLAVHIHYNCCIALASIWFGVTAYTAYKYGEVEFSAITKINNYQESFPGIVGQHSI